MFYMHTLSVYPLLYIWSGKGTVYIRNAISTMTHISVCHGGLKSSLCFPWLQRNDIYVLLKLRKRLQLNESNFEMLFDIQKHIFDDVRLKKYNFEASKVEVSQ